MISTIRTFKSRGVLGKRNERKGAAVKIYKSMAKKIKQKKWFKILLRYLGKFSQLEILIGFQESRNDQLFPNFLSQLLQNTSELFNFKAEVFNISFLQ
jgi:hypothetical protein